MSDLFIPAIIFVLLIVTVNEIFFPYIAPSGQPDAPSVENIGATWASVTWTAPVVASSPISRYEIIA